jgi:signal transduction histidine kinase
MAGARGARASEPFFSTKGLEGSGLGLSMVQGFASQSGGEFRLASVPGEGTTAELLLPLADAEADR